MHEIKVKKVYYDKIKSGEKIYEIRLNDEKRQKIKVGDQLKIWCEPELVECLVTTVVDKLYYSNFEELLKNIPAAEIGFAKYSSEEIIKTYHQFYTESDELQYGIVAIKLEI